MKIPKKWAGFALALLASTAANAGDKGTIYQHFSNWGLGFGYAQSINEDWALRGQYNTLQFNFLGSETQLNSTLVLADWYPSASNFRMTGGIAFNGNKRGEGKTVFLIIPSRSYVTKENESPSAYIGGGYSVRPKDAKGWGFNMDVGVTWNNPTTKIDNSDNGLSQAQLNSAMEQYNDRVNKVQVIAGAGFSYSF